MSLPDKSNAIKQILCLLRRHRTPIHEAKSVFALTTLVSKYPNTLDSWDIITYDLSRPLPYSRIARHNLIVVHSWRTLRYLCTPEGVFWGGGFLGYVCG